MARAAWRGAAALALAVWLAVAVFAWSGAGRRLEALGFDLLSVISAPARVEAPLVIVGIDEPSFADLDRPWPWPRRLHADLIDALHQAGAAVIVFDVVFAEPSDTEDDTRLAAAIRRAGNVILAADLAVQEAGQYALDMRVEPMPELRAAGARSGLASVSFDPDLVVRQVPGAEDALWRVAVEAFRPRGLRLGGDAGELIRYLGPDHAFRYVSYYQALDPQRMLPPGVFKDKIVLIGHDAKVGLGKSERRGDAFATPFSAWTGLLTPGVEIHATLIANALAGHRLRAAPASLPLMLAAGALLLLVAWTWRSGEWQAGWAGLAAGALGAGLSALGYVLFTRYEIWLPLVNVLLAIGLMYVAQVGFAFVREQIRRRQVEQAFRHYVAPEVVRQIVAHPELLQLGGARREITLMFTDLAGFTSVAEQMSPEDIAALLNDYLTHMTRIVMAHGGTVDKFIGDAIMAFWGAPLDDPLQARHACAAAQAMQNELALLRERYRSQGLPELKMRIGLHSGPAIVGNMGSQDHFDYTAIGDNVNLASRLEGINKLYGTGILLSDATAAQLGTEFGLRFVDRVIVKGRTQAVGIWTPCNDAELVRLTQAAFDHYAAQRWSDARVAWDAVRTHAPDDLLAPLFLTRIKAAVAAPPTPGWDGSTALDKL